MASWISPAPSFASATAVFDSRSRVAPKAVPENAVIAAAAVQTTKTLFIFFFIFDSLHVNLCRKKLRFHFFVKAQVDKLKQEQLLRPKTVSNNKTRICFFIFSIILPVLLPGVRGQGACGYLPHTEYRYKASQGLFRSGHKVLPSLPEVLRGSDPPHT